MYGGANVRYPVSEKSPITIESLSDLELQSKRDGVAAQRVNAGDRWKPDGFDQRYLDHLEAEIAHRERLNSPHAVEV
jgi:hypothetical protein